MGMEEDFLLDAEYDAKAVEYIKSYLPQDLKEKFTDDDLYYIMDVIAEYYTSSECLEAEPDEEGYIDVDLDAPEGEELIDMNFNNVVITI